MNWIDYEGVWKRQPLPKGAEADVNELRRSFEASSRKLEASLRVRDYTEAGAGFMVAGAYGFFWWQMGVSGWPMSYALILILCVSSHFIRERFRARRCRVKPEAPLLVKVEADIAELRRQCRFVENLWFSYLVPCGGAMTIHFWVVARRAASWSPLRDPWFVSGMALFLLLILWFAWWVNWRTLRTRLRPRLAELEKLRDELRAEETSGPITADRR